MINLEVHTISLLNGIEITRAIRYCIACRSDRKRLDSINYASICRFSLDMIASPAGLEHIQIAAYRFNCYDTSTGPFDLGPDIMLLWHFVAELEPELGDYRCEDDGDQYDQDDADSG